MLKGYPRLCPGQFYYGAYGASESYENLGEIEIGNPDDFKPGSYMFFMLGGFGAIDNTGHDTIRWKDMDGTLPPKFPYISQEFCYLSADGTETGIHLRLPEIVGGLNELVPLKWPPLDDNGYLITGAPDGFRDGVIIEVWGSRQERQEMESSRN